MIIRKFSAEMRFSCPVKLKGLDETSLLDEQKQSERWSLIGILLFLLFSAQKMVFLSSGTKWSEHLVQICLDPSLSNLLFLDGKYAYTHKLTEEKPPFILSLWFIQAPGGKVSPGKPHPVLHNIADWLTWPTALSSQCKRTLAAVFPAGCCVSKCCLFCKRKTQSCTNIQLIKHVDDQPCLHPILYAKLLFSSMTGLLSFCLHLWYPLV